MSQIETIAENIAKLTVLDAAKLVKILEETLGVSAAAPVAAAAAPAAAAPAAAEQTEFSLVLLDAGATKINVIKEVRAITQLGLAEAKALVDGAPKVVKEGLSKEEVAKYKEILEKAGAKVEVK